MPRQENRAEAMENQCRRASWQDNECICRLTLRFSSEQDQEYSAVLQASNTISAHYLDTLNLDSSGRNLKLSWVH